MKRILLITAIALTLNLQAYGNTCADNILNSYEYLDDYEMERKIGTKSSQLFSMNILVRSCYRTLQICNGKENELNKEYENSPKLLRTLLAVKNLCEEIVKDASNNR